MPTGSSLLNAWPWLVLLAHVAGAMAVTVDAVLRKRHVQAIFGWIGLAWLAPFIGAFAYLCFGINRIRRTATTLHLKGPRQTRIPTVPSLPNAPLDQEGGAWTPALKGLEHLGSRVTGNPLLSGNQVTPLENGDAAFPAMLSAIDNAQRSVALQTYIFDSDEVGAMFCEALVRAARRGVAVRVLIDDVGARYSRSSMLQQLRTSGVVAATFLPTSLPRLFRYANLRNHRKIMVVDGKIGFTGGMNIRAGHWLSHSPLHPTRCLHFKIEGPLVVDLQQTFAIDWAFATGETLEGEHWFLAPQECGSVMARGIAAGPDEDLGKMPNIVLGALAAAEHSVYIMTPYFLPDDVLLRTLQITAMRGVEINLVLPLKSNLRVMDWAMKPQLHYLLDEGCRIYLSPPPFDHTKVFVVDGCWSLIGSTNWDARSLRLNFEYNVECYDSSLAKALQTIVHDRIRHAQPLTAAMLHRSTLVRLRDGLARLLSPYL